MNDEKNRFNYDVALSFAGDDRDKAQDLTDELQARSIKVFYDFYEKAELWGKDLYQHLQKIYRDEAEYCVLLVSKSYAENRWTKHELKQAQARAFEEHSEYILPVILDDTKLPGLNSTTGYLRWDENAPESIATEICIKLGKDPDYSLDMFTEVLPTLEMLETFFMSIPNVTGVSIGRRLVQGIPIREWCIRVNVRKKLHPRRILGPSLPTEFRGVTVDVVED